MADAYSGVREQGESYAETVLRGTLSVDHRVMDGVVAAALLRALQRIVDVPEHLASARA
jgi:pyruvate/2-oxoglutarate dehydrogenase complex dihydrolipoamide acyltransferase (E2) component